MYFVTYAMQYSLPSLISDEEIHKSHSLPSIIRMIKSRRMRWEGYLAHMGRRGMHIGFWWENQRNETTRVIYM
jgi:hypothetical protein